MSGSKHNRSNSASSSSSKKNCITIPDDSNNTDISQWIPNTGKTSFVWKFFQTKTDGRAYCRKIDKEVTGHDNECGYNCAYKSQTSSMLYHIHNFHKQFEKKLEVGKRLKTI